MSLFSDVARTDPSPAAHGDSHFQFLDRVSGPYWEQVRGLIEDWFSRHCPDAQADVRGRLRSKDDRQFNGAFFELYLHECLLRMGYAVTCHPKLEGTSRRPDFLAEKDGASMYVEARSASSSDVSVGATARVNAVYESLDKLDSPNFFLWIDVAEQGAAPIGARALRRRLEKWLAGLDPEDYQLGNGVDGLDALPTVTHEDADWRIEFRPIPKSHEARGKEGVRPLGIFGGGRAGFVEDEKAIRDALSDKGSAYGALGAPFVVAVASSSLFVDDHDLLNALYGTEVIELSIAPDGTKSAMTARKPDGYWFAGDHWEHREVSAVLVVKQLHPAFVGTQRHTIWEHPDPEVAVAPLPMWRRSVVDADGHMGLSSRSGPRPTGSGLGDPWPVGEAFPRE